MGLGVIALLVALAAAQNPIAFTFNETFALYGPGTFWDNTFSRIAMTGTSHTFGGTDPYFFNDGRGLVYDGSQIARLPPHPLDPAPIVLKSTFALELWFRADLSSTENHDLLCKQNRELSDTLLCARFRRTSVLNADPITVEVLTIQVGGTMSSQSFSYPAANRVTSYWDRWFHMVINVDTSKGSVYLDGVLQASFTLASAFSDIYADGPWFLGGRTSQITTLHPNPVTYASYSSTVGLSSGLSIYSVKIYTSAIRTEAQVRSAITNDCEGRFDNGSLRYLCDACPVNLGKCLYSGCSQTGFQRTSSECKASGDCSSACNGNLGNGHCTSDSRCAACPPGYYLNISGECSGCSALCLDCSSSSVCHECMVSDWQRGLWQGPGKCTGSPALRLDGTCLKDSLSLPIPPNTPFPSWAVEFWVYVNAAATAGETDANYPILDLGDYKVTYTRTGLLNYFRLRHVGGSTYDSAQAFTVGKWMRVALSMTASTGRFMLWTGFAEYALNADFTTTTINNPTWGVPKQILLGAGRSNVLMRDLRLWNSTRAETDVFDSLFKIIAQPPTTLVSYWLMNENAPVILDYSLSFLNRTLPGTRGLDCWWNEQSVQYRRHSNSGLADISQVANSGTVGFLQCPQKRRSNDILMLCNEEIRFVFGSKCMPQDIPDINRTVIGRRGASELAEVDADPVFKEDGHSGLYFGGKSYIEIDPKRQALQPLSETRSTTRQSDSRGVRMPLSLMAFSVQAWVYLDSAAPGGLTDNYGELDDVYSIFSIMHTNGHHQFIWYVTSSCTGVSMRSAASGFSGYRTGFCETHAASTGKWTFLGFSFSLNDINNQVGTGLWMVDDTAYSSTIVSLGLSTSDYVVRNQAPMYIGASVKGTVLGNFFKGYIFEFALSNYYKSALTFRELDKLQGEDMYSVWFGAKITRDNMLGDVCSCHYTCSACKSPRTGLATDCTSCSAPLVLTPSGTCDLVCPAETVITSETQRICTDPKAPTVASVALRSDYLGLDVTFSDSVAPAISGNNCERMFAFETNLLFGTDAYCFSSSSTVISVIFGLAPTLALSSTISLNPTGILKASSPVLSYAKVGPYSITAPATISQPTAVLAGPDMSPVSGQSVTIDASFSKGGLGQQLTYAWTVAPNNGPAFSSDLQAYLVTYTAASSKNSRLTIPASLVPVSTHVVYTVTVKNWLGGSSSLSLDSFHTLKPVPVMFFVQGRVWRTRRPLAVPLQLSLARNTNVNIPADYQLELRLIDTNANLVAFPFPDLPIKDFNNRNATLVIPANTLQPSSFYRLVLELTSTLFPERNTFTSVKIDVDHSPLFAQIEGGDRVIGVLDSVSVTSRGSIDPDTQSDATLTYLWTCDLCTVKTGKDASFGSALPSTTAGSTATVTLTVGTNVKGDARTTSVTSQFIIVAGQRPYVYIHRLPKAVNYQLNPENPNYLNAEVYNLNNTIHQQPNVLWTADPAPVDYTPVLSPKKHFLNTVLLPGGLYLPTRSYKVTITLEENGVHTWAWLTVPVNARPIGCCFTVTKVASSHNLFLFDAGIHDDPDANYPLSFQFYLTATNTQINFPKRTPRASYHLPSYHNSEENYQQQFYAVVRDSLGAQSVRLPFTAAVYPEEPLFTLDYFISEASSTFGLTYNQTELSQYIASIYGTYIWHMLGQTNAQYSATSELTLLASSIQVLLSTGEWNCRDMKAYLKDLWLMMDMAAEMERSTVEGLYEGVRDLVERAWANPDWNCLSQSDREKLFEAISSFSAFFPNHTSPLFPLPALLETFSFLSLRPFYPSHSLSFAHASLATKLWRLPANNSDQSFAFYMDDMNATNVGKMGVVVPASLFAAKPLGSFIDIMMVSYGFSPFAPLRLANYPELLATKQLDRYDIVENSDYANILQIKIYDSGLAVQNVVSTLPSPLAFDVSDTPVSIQLPLAGYDPDSFLYSTCESWSSNPDLVFQGEWTLSGCEQTATVDSNGVSLCKCTHLSTFTANVMAESNKGTLQLELKQPTLAPEYDFSKEKNDNRAFMFYMNPIYLLFILWSLHGGLIILAFVADRDLKGEFGREEYLMVAITERIEGASQPPLPVFSTYWLNEWFLTGLIRSTKIHYTRCARVHILFSKLYVLLLVPGFFYTYYWTSHEAFDIHGYDWGVTVIALICSAATQGVLSVLSNTRNVPVNIKRGLYFAYFGLWTTVWLAIGFWTAKGTTQTASIWCVVWILCAFIDVLILDHLYVLVKWGFDSATDYWRTVAAPEEENPAAGQDAQPAD